MTIQFFQVSAWNRAGYGESATTTLQLSEYKKHAVHTIIRIHTVKVSGAITVYEQ